MRILFVCLGNICRSPIAEGVMRHYALQRHHDWQIASAGTESYHIGEPPHRYSQNICKAHGIDISGQRARKFVAKDFDQYDKILAMSSDVYDIITRAYPHPALSSKLGLFLNELHPDSNASVPDPWYGEEDGYAPVYDMIEATCLAILEAQEQQRKDEKQV